jgi:hypothetical protein
MHIDHSLPDETYFKNHIIDLNGELKNRNTKSTSKLCPILPMRGNLKPPGFMVHYGEMPSRMKESAVGYLLDSHTKKRPPNKVTPFPP